MQLTNNQYEKGAGFNELFENSTRLFQSAKIGCSTADLAFYSLKGQAVTLPNVLLDELQEQTSIAVAQHYTDLVDKNKGIIAAFLDKGFIKYDQLVDVCENIKNGSCEDHIKAILDTGLTCLLDNIDTHVKERFEGIMWAENGLAKIKKDFELYSLSIEQTEASQYAIREASRELDEPYKLTLSDRDFMQHVYVYLDKIKDPALKKEYVSLLNHLMKLGGIWQPEVVQQGSFNEWTPKTQDEVDTAINWLIQLEESMPENIEQILVEESDAMLSSFLENLSEMFENYFYGEELDNESAYAWVLEEGAAMVEIARMGLFISNTIKTDVAPFSGDEIELNIYEKIQTLRDIVNETLGVELENMSTDLPSFILDEENQSYFGFVLAPFEENEMLNRGSQSIYEHYLSADEGRETYRIALDNSDWLNDLRKFNFALHALMLTVNVVADSLLDTDSE